MMYEMKYRVSFMIMAKCFAWSSIFISLAFLDRSGYRHESRFVSNFLQTRNFSGSFHGNENDSVTKFYKKWIRIECSTFSSLHSKSVVEK